jgi:hypothetical protein
LPPVPPAAHDAIDDDEFDFAIVPLADVAPVAELAVAKPMAKRPAAKAKAVASASSSGSSSSRSSSSSYSGSGSVSACSFDVAVGRSDVSKWMEIERGPRCKLDRYKPKHKALYSRWIVECTHHDACTRRRATTKSGVHGAVEPIAWLIAWNRLGSEMSIEQHSARHILISPEDVAREVIAIGDRADKLLQLL